MPKAGLEPACLAAPPPQDGVSANSTTSAVRKTYLPDFSCWPAGAGGVAGVAGGGVSFAGSFAAGAGVAGVSAGGVVVDGVVDGAGGVVALTGTTDRPPGVLDTIVSARDVTMKRMAAAVVAFERMVAAPRWPNAV